MTGPEQWRALPADPEAYEVSNLGEVRSYARGSDPVYLQQSMSGPVGKQYRAVTLRGGRQRKVHHLVLETFVGPRPEGAHACHNNGDKLDNRLDNLRWDTPSANNRDKRTHGTDHQVRKTHCPNDHEYTEENTYGGANAQHRRCKTCARARARAQVASGYISPSKRRG